MTRRRNFQQAARGVFGHVEWLLVVGDLPPLAAHLVSPRNGYSHHGIHVGSGRVVHYAGLARGWRPGPVEEISLAEFACGGRVWVRPYATPRFALAEVVARACSRLGENSYHILSNNCEHFCEWCVRGEHRSRQVDAWRSWPKRNFRAVAALLARRPRGPAGTDGAWAV